MDTRLARLAPSRGSDAGPCAGRDRTHAKARTDASATRVAAMTASQRIVRVRRTYNQWVANQTLEDYALRFTAKTARKWSSLRVANTAIGAISFLALEAIGGAITVNYGFAN